MICPARPLRHSQASTPGSGCSRVHQSCRYWTAAGRELRFRIAELREASDRATEVVRLFHRVSASPRSFLSDDPARPAYSVLRLDRRCEDGEP